MEENLEDEVSDEVEGAEAAAGDEGDEGDDEDDEDDEDEEKDVEEEEDASGALGGGRDKQREGLQHRSTRRLYARQLREAFVLKARAHTRFASVVCVPCN